MGALLVVLVLVLVVTGVKQSEVGLGGVERCEIIFILNQATFKIVLWLGLGFDNISLADSAGVHK